METPPEKLKDEKSTMRYLVLKFGSLSSFWLAFFVSWINPHQLLGVQVLLIRSVFSDTSVGLPNITKVLYRASTARTSPTFAGVLGKSCVSPLAGRRSPSGRRPSTRHLKIRIGLRCPLGRGRCS